MYTITHLSRPRGAKKTTTRPKGVFDKYDDAKAAFDKVVEEVTTRTRKRYLKWRELKWHEQDIDAMDFFQVWDERSNDPYLRDATIETVMLEAHRG
jgi:hypothetical protein